MEQLSKPACIVTSKSIVETQEESEGCQLSHGDCLGHGFVSNLPMLVNIDTPQGQVADLRDIWGSWDSSKKGQFSKKFGDLALLLSVQVDFNFIRAIICFWDPSYRCFSFNQEDLTPTIEEYATLLRLPSFELDRVYRKQVRHVGVRKRLAEILGIACESVGIVVKKGDANDCIPWTFLKKFIFDHSDDARSIDAFALAIYGLVIFPRVPSHIEASVVSLFERVVRQFNPVPAILAETIRSLNHCRRTGRGKLIGCIPLLYVWARSHFWGPNQLNRRIHMQDFCPITEFCGVKWSTERSKKEWITDLCHVKKESINWRAPWFRPEHILYSCDQFRWVPLMGIWGVVSYAPLLVRRQFGSLQFIPMTHDLDKLEYAYGDVGSVARTQKIAEAWMRLNRSEIGCRTDKLTPKYQAWRVARVNSMVLPKEENTGRPPKSIVDQPKPSEMDFMREGFIVEKRKWAEEAQNLKDTIGDLKVHGERQEAKIRKLTKDNDDLRGDLCTLYEERSASSLSNVTKELEDARREIEYLRRKGLEDQSRYATMRSHLMNRDHKIAGLEKIILEERTTNAHYRQDKAALQELVNDLNQEILDENEKFLREFSKQEERYHYSLNALHKAQDEKRAFENESEGRLQYIEYLTKEMKKASTKAKEMTVRVGRLREAILPRGKHSNELDYFLIEVQDHYKQVKTFFEREINLGRLRLTLD